LKNNNNYKSEKFILLLITSKRLEKQMTRFIAILSGKGGVGKTTTTVNVGHALAKQGYSTLLVDANLATPNIGVHLGLLNPSATLNHFLRKEKHIRDIIHSHESGVSFAPASPSYAEFQKTNPKDMHKLFEHLDNTLDFVLIDCPSGFGPELHAVLKHTDEALIVANPTTSSVMEALKSLEIAKSHNNIIPGIVLNKTHFFSKFQLSTPEVEDLLGLHVIGCIKNDKKIRKSHHLTTPVTSKYPRSKSAKEFSKIADTIAMKLK
jgi:septum site-determining protein MinD